MRVLVSLALIAFASPVLAFDPTETYSQRDIRGFTVRVNPEVAKHADDEKAALAELDAQLGRICEVVPARPLAALKKITIWIEWETKKKGAAEFHVSAGWLKANDFNPDKLKGVEINNARNFVAWSKKTQPWMVLHELAHAYHFTVLGDKHAPLHAAYKQALERKLYDEVAFITGGKKKAYAATNAAEYFAELSEAYFGKNDFFPFTRTELEKHDPAGFEMLKKAWGR
jgi:hypothetical protein